MKSHEYDFGLKDLTTLTGPSIILLCLFVAVMHGGAKLGLLPPPQPRADVDQTILAHQAESSVSRHEADILLIGDSSCLMDCSARRLETLLPNHKVLNLGTLSYLDLRVYGDLLRRYTQTNPGQLRAVVVLVHPEMLNGVDAAPYHVDALNALFRGADHCETETVYDRLSCWLGLEILRGRLLNRLLPTPLPQSYGRFYGFNTGLRRYLAQNNGSAIDPRPPLPKSAGTRSATYSLSDKLEASSRGFKSAVPPGIRLIVGITPVPDTHVSAGFRLRYQQMVAVWSQWMKADATLTNLPPTLPAPLFGSATHLSQPGTRYYTKTLARALAPLIQNRDKADPGKAR